MHHSLTGNTGIRMGTFAKSEARPAEVNTVEDISGLM